jgi:hypothetical protein
MVERSAVATAAAAARRQRHRPALVLQLLVVLCVAAAPSAVVAGHKDRLEEYVVVFKRGFDAAKVKALCSEQAAGVAGGRLQGLCKHRFSAVLNGFAGTSCDAFSCVMSLSSSSSIAPMDAVHLGPLHLRRCRSSRQTPSLPAGFAGAMTGADVEALHEAFPGSIDYIERDSDFTITGIEQPDWLHSDGVPHAARQQRRRHLEADRHRQLRRAAVRKRRKLPEQQNPVWTLDRIDQQSQPLDRVYHYESTGTGVNV